MAPVAWELSATSFAVVLGLVLAVVLGLVLAMVSGLVPACQGSVTASDGGWQGAGGATARREGRETRSENSNRQTAKSTGGGGERSTQAAFY